MTASAEHKWEKETPHVTVAGADGLTQTRASKAIFRISYTGSMETHVLAD